VQAVAYDRAIALSTTVRGSSGLTEADAMLITLPDSADIDLSTHAHRAANPQRTQFSSSSISVGWP
jgi:hypothetical protein